MMRCQWTPLMFRRRAGWQHDSDSAEDTPDKDGSKDLETQFVRWSTTTVQGGPLNDGQWHITQEGFG